MNLPNKLTLLRIALVPIFVFFLLADSSSAFSLLALLVFVVASLTDMLDGKIARRYNLITTFGKLMDPLADKILVMSAMICFVALGLAPAWVVIVILAREFLVTSLRLIAAGEGRVIAADKWGKVKTVTQMFWIIWVLLWLWMESSTLFGVMPTLDLLGPVISALLMLASVFFTLLSGFNYVFKNRALLFGDM
ncbi:MAG TPA: CDP-diacylglycerol--glycerol-3-phosphate 3-phosphatidyltransferase [Clostridia bacterium]|nr:CDP-diacylglycerol--glycerol-3-phosphate 3-phosphatidyltransferase [Clostridia bacterium]